VTYRFIHHFRGEELAEKYLRKLRGRLLRWGFSGGFERVLLELVNCNRGRINNPASGTKAINRLLLGKMNRPLALNKKTLYTNQQEERNKI
jgi:hypothetical protein